MIVWLNGALAPAQEARIDPSDRGFALGDGVFETLLVRRGVVANLTRHLRRLRVGLEVIDLLLDMSDADLAVALRAVLAANALSDAALRLTVTRGPAARGLWPNERVAPTVLIAAAPGGFTLGAARLVVAAATRRNEASPLSRIKSCNALDAILAKREALARGADDALLVDTRGRLAEATSANVFALRGGAWTTPPVADGALPGVVREILIERAGAIEASLAPTDLRTADAVVLTNSLGLREGVALDGAPLGRRPELLGELARLLEDEAKAGL